MRLSKHFIERWQERLSTPVPSGREIEGMVNESVLLQRQRDLFTPRGRRIRVLATYWVTAEKIVLKVDEKNATVVTVLTEDMVDEEVA